MKLFLICISVLILNVVNSQTIMGRNEFVNKISDSIVKTNDSIKKVWESELTNEDRKSLQYVNELTKIDVLDMWVQTDYNSNISGFSVSISNHSKKTIKYIHFKVIAYNAVDDVVYDGVKLRTGVGPVEYGNKGTWDFDYCWYLNNSIDYLKLISVTIEYKDKTKKTITNVGKHMLDQDKIDLAKEVENKLTNMINEHYDRLYDIYVNKISTQKKIEKQRNQDSIVKQNKHISDSISYVRLMNVYKQKLLYLQSINLTIDRVSTFNKKKQKFILKKFNIDVVRDIKLIKDTLVNIPIKPNMVDKDSVKNYVSNMDTTLINNIFKYFCWVYHFNHIEDKDVVTNKLSKTYMYINYKTIISERGLLRQERYEEEIKKFNETFNVKLIKVKSKGRLVPLIILPPFISLAILVGVIGATE